MMPYTPLTQIERQRALSQQLRSTPLNYQGGTLSGLAHVLRQYGAGRGEYLARQQEQENESLQKQDMAQLLDVLRGGNLSNKPVMGMGGEYLGDIPAKRTNFQTPEVQSLLAKSLLDQQLAAVKAGLSNINAEKFGNTPIYGTDANGNIVVLQPSNRGGVSMAQTPQGINIIPPGQPIQMDTGQKKELIDKLGRVVAERDVNLKPEDLPENAAAKAGAMEAAKQKEEIAAIPEKEGASYKAELAKNETKATMAGSAQYAKMNLLDGLIDKARDNAGFWTTGFIGSAASKIPGTDAYDLSKTLDTARANIGFDRLQEMRDNSKSGGALGQVSEMENRLLQAVWGNLEQSQSKEQFLENLELVRKQVKESWQRVYEAYEKDYGKPHPDIAKENPIPKGNESGWSIVNEN